MLLERVYAKRFFMLYVYLKGDCFVAGQAVILKFPLLLHRQAGHSAMTRRKSHLAPLFTQNNPEEWSSALALGARAVIIFLDAVAQNRSASRCVA